MRYDPDRHHRRSIRLRGYNYASAALYFVTICTQGHALRFGAIADGAMCLSDAGQMICRVWESMASRFDGSTITPYVVMPNHFHAVVGLQQRSVGATLVVARGSEVEAPRRPLLGDIVGAFKSITTREYVVGVHDRDWPPFDRRLWQRNYWEHIIRTPESHAKICEYIANNPRTWASDSLHPEAANHRSTS